MTAKATLTAQETAAVLAKLNEIAAGAKVKYSIVAGKLHGTTDPSSFRTTV